MTDTPGSDRDTGGSRRLLTCGVCRRAVDRTLSDLLRHSREGWPRCCGQVMALFTEVGGPWPPGPTSDGPHPTAPG